MAATKRKVSPCISYKPGQEPTVFIPKPRKSKLRPQALSALETAKNEAVIQRLLRRIEDYRMEDRGLL